MIDDQKGLKVLVIGTGAGNMRALAGGFAPPQALIKDPIPAAPVASGPAGKAWLVNLPTLIQTSGIARENDASLDIWVIEVPGAHPAWHSYLLALYHLRPVATPQATLFYLEDATHEITLFALDPDCDRRAIIDGTIKLGKTIMTPANYAGQFHAIGDETARQRILETVQDICDGKLSPDTDYVSMWQSRFGDHMFKDRTPRIKPKEVFA